MLLMEGEKWYEWRCEILLLFGCFKVKKDVEVYIFFLLLRVRIFL